MMFLLLLLLIPNIANATDFYVRTDGGNSTQCTGQSNTAYDGAGSGEACAYSHPFYALGWCGDFPSSCTAGTMASGDDLIISCNDQGDCTGVDFNVGYAASWSGCSGSWSYGCTPKAPPDGTSGNHTTVKGCSSTGCTSADKRPGFYGYGRSYFAFNLNNADYVDVEDIDLFDTGECGFGHSVYNCGTADGAEATSRDGIYITGATNVTLKDMKVYGFYRYGVYGGSVADITFDNVDIEYNSFGGWDLDSCSAAGTCGSSGNIVFQNGWSVNYSGCVMSSTYGTIKDDGCYSQDQTGYGDAVGSGNTAGAWSFTDGEMIGNISDAIDMLYLNNGSYSGGSLTVKRTRFEGNVGQVVKGPNNMLVEDNFIIGNCGYYYGKAITCDSVTCGASFNHCRANGNTIAMSFKSGDSSTPKIYNNTILSNGDVLFEVTGTCTAGTDVLVKNNILVGGRQWNDDSTYNGAGGNDSVSIYYEDTCNADFVEDYNVCLDNFKEATPCSGANSLEVASASSIFTGTLTQGPASGAGYRTTDNYYQELSLTVSSSALNISDETVSGADSVDFNNYSRGASWDAGALEYGSVVTGTKNAYTSGYLKLQGNVTFK